MATEEQMVTALSKASKKASNAKTKLSASDLCGRYKAFRPLIEAALPLIEKRFPPYGKLIVEGIKLLMEFADSACPATPKPRRKPSTSAKVPRLK